MDVINNLFSRNLRRPRSTPSVISSSSGSIRYKWPHRHKRANVQKKIQSEQTIDADSLPGLVRVPADDVCAVCANDLEYLYSLEKCGHRACLDCWRTFASTQVSSFAMAHITCLSCDRRLSRALTIQLLKPPRIPSPQASDPAVSAEQQASADRLYQRYEDFLLHQCLLRDKHTRWCPRGCGYAVLAHGFRVCPRLECRHPNCPLEAFCYRCRGPWSPDGKDHVCPKRTGGGANNDDLLTDNHRSLLSRLHQLFRLPTATSAAPEETGDPGTVDGLIRQFSERRFSTATVPVHAAKSVDDADDDDDHNDNGGDDANHSEDDAAAQPGDVDISRVDLDLPDKVNGQVKPCPRCKTYLLKLDDGSCNHMSCFICGCEFCWLCMREVRDTHYLSPTGCTFWGRQRWPYRRRICAMLLAAFGTPLILAIVTFLALPGITFGFPAYLIHKVGGQITGKKCKRGLLKTLVFFGGLLISPVIAALVALFGIPLVLIYVYIFMPLTLFSELKVRLSSETADPAIDPDVGFKIDWDRVGEATQPEEGGSAPAPPTPSATVKFAHEGGENADSNDEA